MSSPTPSRPRPFGIVVLEILALAQGGFAFLVGLFVTLGRDDADLVRASKLTPNQLLSYGVGAMIVGAVAFLLGLLLGRGSQVARVVFAFFATINLCSGLYAAISFHSEQRLAGVFTTVISGIVLLILFNEKTQAFYDAR